MKSENLRTGLAIATVVFFIVILLIAMYPFINGFFGALIMYVLFSPFYKFLIKKKINRKVAALIVIIISICIILIPIIILLAIIAKELIPLVRDPTVLESMLKETLNLISTSIEKIYPSLELSSFLESQGSQIKTLADSIWGILARTVSGAGYFIVNVIIMYFTLYYLLIEKDTFKKAAAIIPFSKKNSKILIQKFKDLTFSTVVVSGIIALIQGGLLTISFIIFGIKGAIFWGIIAVILSLIPVVGAPIIWFPASIILLLKGNYVGGIGILIFGFILSNIDNIIRPYLQKKVGNIHPLITLIGVFIGIYLFGFFGIIIGPLIITYVLLTLKMFKEDYLK